MKCYFSRLSGTSSALLGLLSPEVERESALIHPIPAVSSSFFSTVQLLTKKPSIFSSIINEMIAILKTSSAYAGIRIYPVARREKS
jgi:hypothetical protein